MFPIHNSLLITANVHFACLRMFTFASEFGANATYMGEYCRTGVNAMIMPGRKIGSYSVVGAGVILNEDVPSQTIITVKQELVKKPWGPSRYGW